MTQRLTPTQAKSLAGLAAAEALNRSVGGLLSQARVEQIARQAATSALKQIARTR